MLDAHQKKIISFYAIGAIVLLLVFRLLVSDPFSGFIDYFIAIVAFMVVIAMTIRGVANYHKDHESLKKVVHSMLINTLALLVITLIAYIMYSPRIIVPVTTVIKNLKQYISLENYFLLALYICLITIAIAIINLLIKAYHRARGSYTGSIRKMAKDTLYTVFFIFAVLFALSVAAYSEAYGPITEFASRAIYNTFLDSGSAPAYSTVNNKGVNSLKEAVNETFKNISESVSGSQEKLATDITETKDNLTEVIDSTSDDLKNDIESRLDIKGGKLKGNLTVNGTLYAEDVIPASNTEYNLGSNSKAWNTLYANSLDYSGGAISLESNKIINLADPTGDQDAATKKYVDTQLAGAGYQSGGGENLDMATGLVLNIGDASTDFTSTGGLNLAGVLTATSTSAHTLGSVTITGGTLDLGANTIADGELNGNWDFNSGDISGVDSLTTVTANLSGTLDLGTNTIADGELNGNWDFSGGDVEGINDLTLDRNLALPETTKVLNGMIWTASGAIYSGGMLFIHNYGLQNTFVGELSGNISLTVAGDEGNNTAIGFQSLGWLTTGAFNTAIGSSAMLQNTEGYYNTASGSEALYSNMTGNYNTAIGSQSLYNNDSGNSNVAIGFGAMYQNTYGYANAAIGNSALGRNVSGVENAAVGDNALYNNTTGQQNVAFGAQSLDNNTSGNYNAASGYQSLYSNMTGSNNTAFGKGAGYAALGSGNVFLGYHAGYSETGSNKLYIDNSNTTTPLIYGDFSANSLIFNGIANIKGAASAVALDIDSNETTADNNIFTVSSDVGGADDLKFKVQADGDVYGDGAIYNPGADYAEYFKSSDSDLVSGELVCINTANNNLIERCKRTKDTNAIGIISSNPAFVGNNIPGAEADLAKKDKDYKLVGLIGQVETKVTNENGEIVSGDSLTAATKAGYAMKADPGDTTVGVALESSDKENDTITVLISRRNKSLTVEQVEAETEKRIAEMEIEDEVNALIDDQLASVETETGKLKADLASLTGQIEEYDGVMAAIQDQIEELKDLTSDEIILAQIDLNKNDIDFIKLTLGIDRVKNPEDVDILGQLSAKEISAGVYSVTNDKDAPTIGTATIAAGETEVIVKTEAVEEKSRVFVTPKAKTAIKMPLTVIKTDDGESFTVGIPEAAEDDLEFDWWLVSEE